MTDEMIINEEEFDNISLSLSHSSLDIANSGESVNKDFYGAINAGLLGKNTDVISNQLMSVSKSIGNVKNIIDYYSNQITSYDNSLINKIDEIEIPQDYLANDSSSVNYYTQVLVAKIDGQAINNSSSNTINEISDIEVNKKDLKNIQGNVTVEQNYDSDSEINEQEYLTNISKNHNEESAKYDSSSSINSMTNLSRINVEKAKEQQYDDNYSLNKQERLTNISNNSVLFDDSSLINPNNMFQNMNKINSTILPHFGSELIQEQDEEKR